MPLVSVGRGRGATSLHVEREGTGEPLLWITGFAISAEIFTPVVPLYAGQYDCIRYDNRGSGRSPASWRLTSIPELAGDAVALLDALDLPSAHVYGLSMGGMVAQEMAIRFPDRVRALVLGGTSHGGPRAVLPSPAVASALGSRRAAPSVRARVVAGALFTDDFRRAHPERVREGLSLLASHPASAKGLTAHWWASVYHDTWSRLPSISAPTLVLHGAKDRLTPVANARRLAERIPGATLAIVEDAAHAYLLEQPEQSHRLFSDWLAAISPVAAGPPLAGLPARTERLSRTFGLPTGALRTARSLTGLASSRRTR